MIKKIRYIGLLIAAALGFHFGSTPDHEQIKTVDSTSIPVPSPIVISGDSFPHITLDKFVGTEQEKKYALDGIEYANKIMRSECFRQELLSETLTETNNLSNADVIKFISERPVKANVEFFTGNWKQNYLWHTIGYETVPFDGWTYINRHFVQNSKDTGSNIIHEAIGHTMGFQHRGNKSTSVPYVLNNVYEKCFDVVIKQ